MLDKRPPRSGDAYLRFIPRTEMDIAVVGAGVNLTLDANGRIELARVALGAVAPTVLLVPEAAAGNRRNKAGRGCPRGARRGVLGGLQSDRRQAWYRQVQEEGRGVLAKRAAGIAYQRAGAK